MLFWIIIALLTAAAVLAVLAPLARAPKSRASAAYAARVYRDQLGELERERTEGRISASEAETARAEIARRLIAVDKEARAETPEPAKGEASPAVTDRPLARRAVALLALFGIPLLSLGLYLDLGRPEQPGEPLAARLSAPVAPDDVNLLVAKVEEHLTKNPEDGRGWDVIAPVYLHVGRADDAARAFGAAIRLLGPTAERQTGLGEAIFMSQEGIVTDDARAAFEAAQALDPTAPTPRFYLALAAEQEGKPDEAVAMLRALLADAPADAPWRTTVEAALARVAPGETPPAEAETAEGGPTDAAAAEPAPADSLPGPTQEQVAAAQNMSTGDRSAMIESMVGKLAERLKSEPDDVEGWLRLIRSYVVLGRMDSAAEAGRSALAGVRDDGARQRVEELLASLRVPAAGPATP